jgi:tetratricopeptide (TPR) repeat protein
MPPPTPPEHRTPSLAVPAALVAALLALAYAGGLAGPFVFDDEDGLLANPSIRRLWPLAIPLSPPGGGKPVSGRPVANFSFALSHALSGPDPAAFRAANLALHTATALLGFGVLRRCYADARMPAALRERARPLALASALLFAAHPLASEVVLYAVQRTEALFALFALLALAALQRSALAETPAERRRHAMLAVAACALGMGSKESMLAVPPLLFLFDRAFLAGSARAALGARGALHASLAACSGIALALALAAPRGTSVQWFVPDYLRAQVPLLWRYAALAVWPRELVLDYGSLDPARVPELGAAAFALAAGVAFAALAAWRWPRAGFPLLWWFWLLAPSSSFAAVISEVGAERRAYLPLFGLLAGAVALVGAALARISPRALRRGFAASLVAALLAAEVARTRERAADYADPERLWRSSVAWWPENPRAWFNLANHLRGAGRSPEAIEAYQTSLRFGETARAATNLGATLASAGRLDAALPLLARAVELDPADARAQANLGLALSLAGRHDAAAAALARAIELEPDELAHRFTRARALYAAGRWAELRAELEAVLARDPSNRRAREMLRGLARETAAPEPAAQRGVYPPAP